MVSASVIVCATVNAVTWRKDSEHEEDVIRSHREDVRVSQFEVGLHDLCLRRRDDRRRQREGFALPSVLEPLPFDVVVPLALQGQHVGPEPHRVRPRERPGAPRGPVR
jgi:hypothetical protein